MRTTTILAIILVAVGIIAFAYEGITYTTRENIVDLGPLKVTTEKTRTIPLPPLVGAVALLGGIVLIVVGKRRA